MARSRFSPANDSGHTFSRVGTINDADFATGLCCGTLYELPQSVGALDAGTLLWAGSVGGDTPGAPMQIKIFHSADRGATWTYLSNCLTATANRSVGGLWEPEFAIAADGSLVCLYSDETQAGHSQVLRLTRSTDGHNWSAPTDVVSSGVAADRPGMAIVRRLPSGRFFMTFELCGPAACTVFYKTSADGSGPWRTLPAPVQINAPPRTSNVCQNYSSPLLPSGDGLTLLGLATDYDVVAGVRSCKTFFAAAATTVASTLTGGAINAARGQAATSVITIEPGGGYRDTVKLSVSVPSYSGSISPSTLSFADGASHSAALTVPGATAAAAMLPIMMLGGAGLAFRRDRRMLPLLGAALVLGSCGGGGTGGSIGGGSGTGTTPPPVTTYNATVTATDTVDSSITASIVIPVTITG